MCRILLITFLLSHGVLHAQTTCSENLSWYLDCIDSIFFDEDSPRCKKALIKDYAASLYLPLNKHLREIKYDPSCEAIEKPLLKGMTSLKVAPNKRYFRGVRPFPNLELLKPGDCLVDKGYTSLSQLKNKAENFTGDGSETDSYILFEVEAHTARERNLGGYTHEKEVILLPGTPLLLKRIEKTKTTNEMEVQSIDYESDYKLETLKKVYSFEEVEIEHCINILH